MRILSALIVLLMAAQMSPLPGAKASGVVDSVADSLIKYYMSNNYSTTYTGQVQDHPVVAISSATVKVSLRDPLSADVGEYKLYLEPNTGYTWQDGTTTPRFIRWFITPADPTGELADITVEPYSETEYALTGSGGLFPTEGVTYISSDPEVGSFMTSGGKNIFVAGGKIGDTTVVASFAGNTNLNSGTWTGTITVAASGGVYIEEGGVRRVYPTLQAAYSALPEAGGTIYVMGDTTEEFGLVTSAGKPVEVVGDEGATLSRAGDFSTFTVTAGSSLSVDDLTVTASSGTAENGGAIFVEAGGSLELGDGAVLSGNSASGKGGAVYVSAGAASVRVGAAAVRNNSAGFGNGIYLEDGASVTVSGAVSGLEDGVAIGFDSANAGAENRGTVDVEGALDSKLTVEFEDPAQQLASGAAYVVSTSGALTPDELKSNMLVRNPGYTFSPQSSGLSVTGSNSVAAATYIGGVWKDYADPQKAIDDAAAAGAGTVYFVSYVNQEDPSLNTMEVSVPGTLNIPAGAVMTFSSVLKSVPSSASPDPVYTENSAVTLLRRASGNTGAMVYVSEGAQLTLGSVTLDGGAVWDGGAVSVTDDGKGGAGTVKTCNTTGVTAHAPVIVNAGTLYIGDGAVIQNNDNNYATPGEDFGSQNYGGGVRNEAGGTLEMTGGTIQNCYSREGGAVMNVRKPVDGAYAGSGTAAVTVSGGTISGCMSQQKGAAIQTIYGGAAVTVTGSANITGNSSLNDLGVLSVEEGGELTVDGGTVTAAGNAIYLYNKYSAQDYAGAATKPFIEGTDANNVGKLTVTGSPAITGKLHIDGSCYVVDTESLEPSEIWYEAYADLAGFSGAALELDFSDGESAFGKVAEWSGGNTPVTYADPVVTDSASRVFYLEMAENGKTVLRRNGYTLELSQTEPNKIAVSGTCDKSLDSFTVEVAGQTAELTASDGVLSGEISFTGGEGTPSFTSTLMPVYGGAAQSFTGPAIDVLLYDGAGKSFTVPANTTYLTETGTYAEFSGGTIPADAALDDSGYATFMVGESIVTALIGINGEPPILEGVVTELADVTNGSLLLNVSESYWGLEFRLNSTGADGAAAYTQWQAPAGGQLSFSPLADFTQYTVYARTPEGEGTLPSAAVLCPGGVYMTLTSEQSAAKDAFEAAYGLWAADTASDPAAALEKYEALEAALAGTTAEAQMALDQVVMLESERLAALEEARDRQAADAWIRDNLQTMKDSVAAQVPEGTRERVAGALASYDELTEGARLLVDGELERNGREEQVNGETVLVPLPAPLTAYRDLTAAEIRQAASEFPGFEAFAETCAGTAQGAASKDEADAALQSFQSAIEPAKTVKAKYDSFVASNDLTARGAVLAGEALERIYGQIASAAGDTARMDSAAASADAQFRRAADIGTALQDYLDSLSELTGESVAADPLTGLPAGETQGAQKALEVSAGLEAAADTAAMNELMKTEVNALLDGLAESGPASVESLIEEYKTAIGDAVSGAAAGELVDFSALVDGLAEKIDALTAAQDSSTQDPSTQEPAASGPSFLKGYKSTAREKIDALAARYDDTEMYSGAREELDRLRQSLLEAVEDVTLSGGLPQARKELESLVEQAESAFAKKAAQGQAQKEFLDGAASLTGTAPDPGSGTVKKALDKIASAEDTDEMNSALRDALSALAEELVDRGGDSDAVLQLAGGAIDGMDSAVLAAKDGEIAPLAPLVGTLRDDIAAQRDGDPRRPRRVYGRLQRPDRRGCHRPYGSSDQRGRRCHRRGTNLRRRQ